MDAQAADQAKSREMSQVVQKPSEGKTVGIFKASPKKSSRNTQGDPDKRLHKGLEIG